jgi:hypothetical protein
VPRPYESIIGLTNALASAAVAGVPGCNPIPEAGCSRVALLSVVGWVVTHRRR